MPEDTLSTAEAAARLGVTTRTIMRMIARGRFPGAYKLDPEGISSPYRIPVVDIERIEEKRKTMGKWRDTKGLGLDEKP